MPPTFEYAQQLFDNKFVTEEQRDKNAAKWCLAVEYLGERWLLAKPLNFAPVKGE